MCVLPRQAPDSRLPFSYDAVDELHSERVVRTPEHATLTDATIMGKNSQRELVWDGGRRHASNLRAAVRKVAHNARTGKFALVDCRG
jgi:hypothetical protein